MTERAFAFAVQIVCLCRLLDKRASVPRTMANQLLCSRTSIGANIHEGQGSQSEADFLSKYCIACKEAYESQYWLKLFVATELLPEEKVSVILKECDELVAILTTIVKKLKAKKADSNDFILILIFPFSLFIRFGLFSGDFRVWVWRTGMCGGEEWEEQLIE